MRSWNTPLSPCTTFLIRLLRPYKTVCVIPSTNTFSILKLPVVLRNYTHAELSLMAWKCSTIDVRRALSCLVCSLKRRQKVVGDFHTQIYLIVYIRKKTGKRLIQDAPTKLISWCVINFPSFSNISKLRSAVLLSGSTVARFCKMNLFLYEQNIRYWVY